MARIVEQDYAAESEGRLTGKALQAITTVEVQKFNLDYDRFLDEELSVRSARILEDAREYVFEVTRHVMQRANQRYGGSITLGNEVGVRLIRPADMEMGVAVPTGTPNSWLFDWVALGAQDVFGTDPDPVDLGDQSNAEAVVIAAWSTDHPSPKTEAIQASKFNRVMFAQPLPWDLVVDGRGGIKTIEANPWFVGFPGEEFTFDARVFATGADALRAVGVYISIGTNLRTL